MAHFTPESGTVQEAFIRSDSANFGSGWTAFYCVLPSQAPRFWHKYPDRVIHKLDNIDNKLVKSALSYEYLTDLSINHEDLEDLVHVELEAREDKPKYI